MGGQGANFTRVRRWGPALVVAVLAAWLGAYLAGFRVPTAYVATATVQLDYLVLGRQVGTNVAIDTAVQEMPIYAGMAHDPAVLADALTRAGIAWPAGRLVGAVGAVPVPNTGLLQVQITDSDPQRAARLANAVAAALIAQAEVARQATTAAVLQGLTQQIAARDAEVASLVRQLAQLPADSPERTGLAARVADANGIATNLRTSYAHSQAQGSFILQQPLLRMSESAVPPSAPIATSSGLTWILVTAVALVAALGALWALDALDTRVRGTADLRTALGLPVLGTIPRE